MIEDVQILLDGYWRWLRDRTSLREIKDWVEITPPPISTVIMTVSRSMPGGTTEASC